MWRAQARGRALSSPVRVYGLFPSLLRYSSVINWTLAFFASIRWLRQKALHDWHIISQSHRLLASRLQQSAGMLIAMLTYHIGQKTPARARRGMVQAPL